MFSKFLYFIENPEFLLSSVNVYLSPTYGSLSINTSFFIVSSELFSIFNVYLMSSPACPFIVCSVLLLLLAYPYNGLEVSYKVSTSLYDVVIIAEYVVIESCAFIAFSPLKYLTVPLHTLLSKNPSFIVKYALFINLPADGVSTLVENVIIIL